MKKHTYFIIFIIACALLIGIWRDPQNPSKHAAQEFNASPLSSGTMISATHKLSPFALTDMNGKAFTQHALKDHWSFVSFGYTSCPNICSATLASMHQIAQRLQGTIGMQFVFVSINPSEDTPSHLQKYFQDPKFKGTPFIGVTGSQEKITRFAQIMGAHVGDEDMTLEHIEHSGTMFLVNPEGKLAAIFTNNDKPLAIANDFREVLHRYINKS